MEVKLRNPRMNDESRPEVGAHLILRRGSLIKKTRNLSRYFPPKPPRSNSAHSIHHGARKVPRSALAQHSIEHSVVAARRVLRNSPAFNMGESETNGDWPAGKTKPDGPKLTLVASDKGRHFSLGTKTGVPRSRRWFVSLYPASVYRTEMMPPSPFYSQMRPFGRRVYIVEQ